MKNVFIFSFTFSFLLLLLWFGWENLGDPIVVQTPENYTERLNGNAGNNGKCVRYQYQEFKVFGITVASRTEEVSGDCASFY